MTDREAQIEAQWTYEISKEKVLKRLVKKGIMTQAEVDDLSERMLEQLDTDKIPGFRLSLCFPNRNCKRKENLQSKIPHPKLVTE